MDGQSVCVCVCVCVCEKMAYRFEIFRGEMQLKFTKIEHKAIYT